ncbi:scn4ab [Symbiodinium natans]|uniref:Scn4ab protein n=1 Tax=Symbiodinium natans TaxID=878477 RepID=A0A812VA66_9DINO|nr:scn4ab [Symbiodinium natans]
MDINGASSRKLQDNAFGAAVLREDRLCRLIQEEFGKQADLLQELSSQIRSAVEREMPLHGHRLHTFHTRESSFAHRPSPSSAKPSKADGDSERVGDLDSAKANSDGNGERGHSKEHSNSFPGDPFWDDELQTKLNEHQKKAFAKAKSATMTSSPHNELQAQPGVLSAVAHKIVTSNAFQAGIMLLILLNLVLLGIEVDVAASLPADEEPEWFQTLNVIIVLIFVSEIVLKFIAHGCATFFCGSDRWWNIFDLAIISASVLETATEFVASAISVGNMDSSHLRIMRFVRLGRALRGVRVMRLLRFISALRSIVFAILSTLWSLVWTLVLLILLFYCFGVILAQLVSDHCRYHATSVEECPPILQRYWSSVPESMLTLFMSITGGLSWVEALEPLRNASSIAAALMLLYEFITIFAILNVVTGVFCNNAIESAKADKEIAIMKQMQWHQSQLRTLKGVFREIDADTSNMINFIELEEALSQQKLSSFMESMDISTQDIWTLFMVLDADESGEISLEEFVEGCMQLQGPAQSVQLARMRYESKIARQEIRKMFEDIRHHQNHGSDAAGC